MALDTITELFRERGFTLPAQDIADAIGISRSSVYSTFGIRSEQLASVLQRYGPARAPGLRELSDAPSPRAALVRVFEPPLAAGAAPQRCLAIDMIVKMPTSSPKVIGLIEDTVEDLQERFVGAIERGQAAGEIAAAVDPVKAGETLLGLYLGRYVLMHSVAARESVLAAVARQAQALLPPA